MVFLTQRCRGVMATDTSANTDNIPMLPGKPDDASQQLAYIFILRTAYTNSWDEISKMYNCIWHHQNTTTPASGVYRGGQPTVAGHSESPPTLQELLSRWHRQTTYPKNGDAMRLELASMKIDIKKGHIPSLNGQLGRSVTSWVELQEKLNDLAEQAGVELTLCTRGLSDEHFVFFTGG